jgi:hypothetical protein
MESLGAFKYIISRQKCLCLSTACRTSQRGGREKGTVKRSQLPCVNLFIERSDSFSHPRRLYASHTILFNVYTYMCMLAPLKRFIIVNEHHNIILHHSGEECETDARSDAQVSYYAYIPCRMKYMI